MNILFICTANMDRSPTSEMLFQDVPGWNTRSAGTYINAVQRISRKLINWSDTIVVMEPHHYEEISRMAPKATQKIIVLGIEDTYDRCSPELVGRLIIEMSRRFKLEEWIKKKFQCS